MELSFSNWLLRREAFTLDTVRLMPAVHGYEHRFEMNGHQFKVALDFHTTHMPDFGFVADNQGIEIKKAYSVTFRGPRGYSLTEMSGAEASRVYSELLSAVKTLLQEKEVNALVFTPFSYKMTIPYHRFYINYLYPDPPEGAGFIKLGTDTYVNKKYLEETYPELMQVAASSHAEQGQKFLQAKERSRREKLQQRVVPENKLAGIKMMNKTYPAFYLKRGQNFWYYALTEYGFMVDKVDEHVEVVPNYQPSDEELRQYWTYYETRGKRLYGDPILDQNLAAYRASNP